MSIEDNLTIVRRWFQDFWGKGNLGVADEILAPDYIGHGDPPNRIEEEKQQVTALRAAFTEGQVTIEDQIAAGDKVVTRWSSRGIHRGEFQGIPPTGKQVTVTGILIQRIAGGKIVEAWGEADFRGVMKQLGAIPEPGNGGG